MKTFIALSTSILGAAAYPFVLEHASEIQARDVEAREPTYDEVFTPEHLAKRAADPVAVSKAQTNCGPIPCLLFNGEKQLVSVSGAHAYMAPKPSDIRGPCPGLNAAANHGYLTRSGIQNYASTTLGLMQAYGFAPDFAAALNAFSAVISGDIVTQQWSIGGPMPFINVGGLLSPPQGISYTHNRYEGDVSIGRNDAYLGHGDAHSLNVSRFQRAYEYCTNDRCTLDKFRQAFLENVHFSVANNPYYFSPALAGAIVPPAAYNFVINFMSNHTAQQPSGYLSRETFMKFFAVSGTYPNFKWNPGQERIPDNWYRRPQSNQYGAVTLVADDAIGWAAYPNGFRLGGNTNGVNTYQGVDVSALTGGKFTSPADLIAHPQAFACLAFQAEQVAAIDELKGTMNQIQSATAFLDKAFAPILSQLKCAPLAKYDGSVFDKYPGYHYNPTSASNS